MSLEEVSDHNFEELVLKSTLPVLVDFWAPWCGPCQSLSPILEEVAAEYAGKIKICKINVDKNSATPLEYGVRGIPTLIFFRDGQNEATKVGALSKSQLTAFIASQL